MTFGGSLVRNARVALSLTCEFLRKSRTKRSFFGDLTRNPLRRSCVSSARNAGESAICPMRAQPFAEIVRVECATCRRECDLSHARATLCGDRACRVREMQARVRFVLCPHHPLRRSRASSARNAGESAICPVPAQPSAEIVRVERAKCRRARRLCSTTLVRGVSGELEDENW